MNWYWASIVAAVATLCATPLLRNVALRGNIIDHPGTRKIHARPTPLLGGAALYIGILAGVLGNLRHLAVFYPLLVGATLVFILGIVEDVRGLSASQRFFVQLCIASLMIALGVRVSFLPQGPWKDIGEITITLVWLVGVTNAYNYLDGMDGLAAGSAAINFFCFFIILFTTRQYPLACVAAIAMGACVGFLPYNLKNARIFLGEAGSTLLGFSLASLALIGNWAQDNIVKIFIPVFILGVPIFDMCFTTFMRVREGKVTSLAEWLRYGGRDHFHHCLVDLGLLPFGAVVFIYFITLSLGLSAIMVSNDSAVEAYLTLSQAFIMFGVIATLIVVGKRRHSGWSPQ